MKKFKVYESATLVSLYEIEAQSEEMARETVEEGYQEPVRTKYIERKIYEVEESNDDPRMPS